MNYRKCNIKLAQCKEDRDSKDMEAFVNKFIASKTNEIFVNYPRCIEAQVMAFEDSKNVYKVKVDDKGQMILKKYSQEKNNTEYRGWCDKIKKRLKDAGIDLEGELFTLVSVRTLIGTEQDKDTIKKVYFPSSMTVPLSICMRRRSKTHFMNVNDRVKDLHARFNENSPAIMLNSALYGVLGKIKHLDKD